MTYKDRELWRLGQKVQWALSNARVVTLRPSNNEMKTAAASLSISQGQAWSAWNLYTWTIEP